MSNLDYETEDSAKSEQQKATLIKNAIHTGNNLLSKRGSTGGTSPKIKAEKPQDSSHAKNTTLDTGALNNKQVDTSHASSLKKKYGSQSVSNLQSKQVAMQGKNAAASNANGISMSAKAASTASTGSKVAGVASSIATIKLWWVLLISIIVLFFSLFVTGLFSTPVNGISATNDIITSINQDIEQGWFQVKSWFQGIQWIEADESEYDPKNEIDVAYIQIYNLINTTLNESYENYVFETIENYCKENDCNITKTKELLKDTYPSGYKDIYRNLNYGELIFLLSFGYSGGAYGDVPSGDWKAQRDFLMDESNWKYFYNISLIEIREEPIFDNLESKDDIQNKGTEKTSTDDSKTSKKKNELLTTNVAVFEIYPYCINDILEMLGIDKNDSYMGTTATYFDMIESDLLQVKNLFYSNGKPRTLYYTLGLDNAFSNWSKDFDSITANDILSSSVHINVVDGSNQRTIWNMLVTPESEGGMGFTKEGAAGLMGNLQAENGFSTSVAPGDQGSIGICQWRKDRADALRSYAAQYNLPVDSIEAQAGYLAYELPSQCSGHYAEIKNASDVSVACSLVARYFERCAYTSSYEGWEKSYAPKGYAWKRFGYSSHLNIYIIDLAKRDSAAHQYYKLFAN